MCSDTEIRYMYMYYVLVRYIMYLVHVEAHVD